MGDDAAFVAAVTAAPDDAAPRLVYADWLDERGDPRGELIRLHFEIAGLRPLDERYEATRARLRELRARIDPGWAVAMGYPPRHWPLFARLPERREDRWNLVAEFVEVWNRPFAPNDGFPEAELAAAEQRLGVRLPAALREWYVLGGRRTDVWSRQDHLLPPRALRADASADTLVFRVENQSCERWGIRTADLGRDDPPVFELNSGVEVSPTVSAFACLTAVYEGMITRNTIDAGNGVGLDLVEAAVRGLSPCDFPDRYWVFNPIRIYEGVDLIVQCHNDEWVYVAARTEAAYLQIAEEVRRHLEVYSG